MFGARRILALVASGGAAVFAAAGAALATITLYLDVLTLAAVVASWRSRHWTGPSRLDSTFAVLVPAHNEEQLIGETVSSLVGQDYPSSRFGVHVVADNCSDRTAELARAAGAEVHERHAPANPGKGPALEWLVAELAARGNVPDAYVVIDADTVADPGFLSAVDDALGSGADVVQGHYSVRNPSTSPVVAFRTAAMAVRTHLRPRGRMAIGGTAGLHGNGMAFRADLLHDRPMSAHLTEDVELQLDLLTVGGTKVRFAPDARVSAEMPVTLEAAEAQHRRWEGGRIDLARRYVPMLVRRSITGGPGGRVAYADAALDVVIPPISVVVAATAAWGVASAARSLPAGRVRRSTGVAVVLLAGQALTVFSALGLVRAPRAVYRSLLGAPRLVAWKVGLWLRVIARPSEATWTRTTRN